LPDCFATGRVIIPDRALDGLNLIWHSDFVISGGGTMNREAAALGVPVYSIFRGTIGAVDKHLSETGRLVLLETKEDIHRKIAVERRDKQFSASTRNRRTLEVLVGHIMEILHKSGAATE
jgi:predicted glycosyltransferase